MLILMNQYQLMFYNFLEFTTGFKMIYRLFQLMLYKMDTNRFLCSKIMYWCSYWSWCFPSLRFYGAKIIQICKFEHHWTFFIQGRQVCGNMSTAYEFNILSSFMNNVRWCIRTQNCHSKVIKHVNGMLHGAKN